MVDRHMTSLFAAMLEHRPVIVTTDRTNSDGEVIKAAGWRTLIREIRRPAEIVHAYGHLDPIIIVEGDAEDPQYGPGLSILLQPSDVLVARSEAPELSSTPAEVIAPLIAKARNFGDIAEPDSYDLDEAADYIAAFDAADLRVVPKPDTETKERVLSLVGVLTCSFSDGEQQPDHGFGCGCPGCDAAHYLADAYLDGRTDRG